MALGSPKLEVHFVGESKPTLARISLSHPVLLSSPFIRSDFPMVAGVRGVCLLLLATIQGHMEETLAADGFFHVRSNHYLAPVWAACKKRRVKWPVKFLGVDGSKANLRRLVQVRGKETSREHRYDDRKVRINSDFIPIQAIEIYWQKAHLSAPNEIQKLQEEVSRMNDVRPTREHRSASSASKLGVPLKNLKRAEADELEFVKATVFNRLGKECPRADHLISWGEFFPCSLETDEFMRGHHESVYRDIMGQESDWKDIVKSFNESGADRRMRLDKERKEGTRTWKFVHMMFQSDLERIATSDPEYRRCTPAMKVDFFNHLLKLIDDPGMNLELGYVPSEHESVFGHSKWKGWRLRFDSVVRVEAKGVNLFSFGRNREWRLRELKEPNRALVWLNAVRERSVFDRTKIKSLLRKIAAKCGLENIE